MSIEKAAQNVENEAMRNPQEAAASIKLLDAAQQDKIFNQMQRDAPLFGTDHRFRLAEQFINLNVICPEQVLIL